MTVTQTGPDPVELRRLVDGCVYKPGWSVQLEDIDRGQGSAGLTLTITVIGPDSYHPERSRRVAHLFIVPAASYNEQSWRRWLFERFRDVETHELCEFFQIDGGRPYAPNHGAGNDPYFVFELGTVAGAERTPGT